MLLAELDWMAAGKNHAETETLELSSCKPSFIYTNCIAVCEDPDNAPMAQTLHV